MMRHSASADRASEWPRWSAGWSRLLALGLILGGCSSAATREARAPESDQAKRDAEIATPTTVISPSEAISVEELLERAEQALLNQDYPSAERDFRKVFEHAADPARRLRGLVGWGTALDLGGKPEAALSAYTRYIAEAPEGDKREAIRVRRVRLLIYLEQYDQAARESERMNLAQHGPLPQVALLAARALAQVERGNLDSAERLVIQGRAIVDAHSLDRVTVPPLDVAALFLALGDVYRLRAEEISFNPIPANFPELLEKRCQLILDAQGAYSEAMRSLDAHYSSMAGVKVGGLYQDLHAELMSMPVPKAADTEQRKQLFEGALRLRYSILLRKALAMMKATVDLLERSDRPSRWRKKAEDALRAIERAQAREEAAIDALPYTRAQLQQVLDDMAARAQGRVAAPDGS